MTNGALAECGVVAIVLSVRCVVVVVVVTGSWVAQPVTAQTRARMMTTIMGLIFIGRRPSSGYASGIAQKPLRLAIKIF
jgi:hypothetical protein